MLDWMGTRWATNQAYAKAVKSHELTSPKTSNSAVWNTFCLTILLDTLTLVTHA